MDKYTAVQTLLASVVSAREEKEIMPKMKQTPGNVLSSLLQKYDLNYNRLAKAIGLSSAMIRLIVRDESPISASVAYRLAKFFKTKPEFWLALQLDFDCAQAAEDKKLAKALEKITTVDKATFERKPRAKKQGTGKAAKPASKGRAAKKPAKKAAVAKKTAGKRAKPAAKAATPKSAQKKTAGATAAKKTPSVKRGRPAEKTAAKPSAPVKKAPPVVKPAAAKPEQKPVTAQPAPPPQPRPVFNPDPVINEPEI
ncbi:MAG: HigA family addiction module antidote protein [Treponema sp.]|nr:HigA family addiction module antidote protein [Treponema sp.]